MSVLAWITAIVLAAGFGMAGMAKVARYEMVLESAERLGFTPTQYQLIGFAEVAAAFALMLERFYQEELNALGILAAVGLILLGSGALFFHRRAMDPVKEMAPIGVMTLVAILHLVALV